MFVYAAVGWPYLIYYLNTWAAFRYALISKGRVCASTNVRVRACWVSADFPCLVLQYKVCRKSGRDEHSRRSPTEFPASEWGVMRLLKQLEKHSHTHRRHWHRVSGDRRQCKCQYAVKKCKMWLAASVSTHHPNPAENLLLLWKGTLCAPGKKFQLWWNYLMWDWRVGKRIQAFKWYYVTQVHYHNLLLRLKVCYGQKLSTLPCPLVDI